MQGGQDAGAQIKRFAKNQSQSAPVAYENPLISKQQQEKSQSEENGRMHQPL